MKKNRLRLRIFKNAKLGLFALAFLPVAGTSRLSPSQEVPQAEEPVHNLVSVDEIISQNLENQTKLKPLHARFKAKCLLFADEAGVLARKGEVTGIANGELLRHDDGEICAISVGEIFNTVLQDRPDGTKGLLVPFPGAHCTVTGPDLRLRLSSVTGSGIIGPADSHFPRQLFHPLQGLGVVASDEFCDPLHWLIFPPEKTRFKSKRVEGNEEIIQVIDEKKEIEVHFDLSKGAAVSFFRSGSGDSSSYCQVHEFVRLENDGWFPKSMTAVFSAEEFPKRGVLWELEQLETDFADQPIAMRIVSGSHTVTDMSMFARTTIKNESTLGPEQLITINNAIGLGMPIADLGEPGKSTRVIEWPKATDTSKLNAIK